MEVEVYRFSIKRWSWLIFLGVLFFIASCAGMPYRDVGRTIEYEKAMERIGEANGIDVSGISFWVNPGYYDYAVLFLGDGRMMLHETTLRNLPLRWVTSIMAHELGHREMGHLEGRGCRGWGCEFEADCKAVGLLRGVSLYKWEYVEFLKFIKMNVGGDGVGENHPSFDDRIRHVEEGCE